MRLAIKILAAVVALLVILVAAALLTDWRFLRGPVARLATEQLGRPVMLDDFRMKLRPVTRIRLSGLQVANLPDAKPEQMARVEQLEVEVRVFPLLRRKIVIERLAVNGGQARLTRDAQGNNNWTLPQKESSGPPPDITLRTLSFSNLVLDYDDRLLNVTAHVKGDSETPPATGPAYATRLSFNGKFNGGTFGGTARTGGVVSLRDSDAWFPFFIDGTAGKTSLRAEGQVADIAAGARVDVRLDIAGPSLSTLYPYINLPLPTTPPYRIKGRLQRTGPDFRLTGMDGRIGGTDIAGDASYEPRQGKPFMKAALKSRLLDMKDLGPLIGVGQDTSGEPKAAPPADPNRRILPNAEFHLDRLNAIDADVTLDAADVKVEGPWAFDNFSTHLLLQDGVLKLVPLNFGYAGGTLRSDITLDARQPLIRTQARIAVRRARLNRLFPNVKLMETSDGALGANVQLTATGNSVAAMLGRADGDLGMAVTGGDISTMIMELVGLDVGQALGFLVAGDRPTRLRCAVASFGIQRGLATSQAIVVDTNDTRIDGAGTVSFADERLDIRLKPAPKDKSILVARSPITIDGTFAKPGFKIDKTSLFTRLGASVALGLLNPLAALIPLIETGPGTDADCQELLAGLRQAAQNAGPPPPDKTGKGGKTQPRTPKPTPPKPAPARPPQSLTP